MRAGSAARGARLGGRYRLTTRIAGGGMGEVWRATDEVLGRQVAVKVLRADLAGDPSFRTRFRAEARHTAALTHPGIAAVYDYDEGEPAFLVMELVPGEALSAVLAREGRLDPARTLSVVAGAAEALAAAHAAGVVHRDVKPGNLLITPEGRVKVTDFGVARARGAAPLTETGAVMGTAHYLSPEQVAGRPAGAASDLYALGVVAYECLAGRRPFGGDSAVQVALAHAQTDPPPLPADVPEPVRRLVTDLLAKDPAARGGDAAALAARAGALRAAQVARVAQVAQVAQVQADTVPTPRVPADTVATERVTARVQPGPARGRRRTRAAALLAGAVLVGLLGVALAQVLRGPDGTPTAATTPRSAASSPSSEPESSESSVAGEGTAQAPTTGVRDLVVVDPDNYLGRPFEQVREELTALGLVVRPAAADGEEDVGTVSAVAPSGEVPVGDRVTVTVVTDEPGKSGEDGPGGRQGHGQPKAGDGQQPDRGNGKGDDD